MQTCPYCGYKETTEEFQSQKLVGTIDKEFVYSDPCFKITCKNCFKYWFLHISKN
jgi:NAD-dependent dihydropyrimidine dehydrogenase PreA subunit